MSENAAQAVGGPLMLQGVQEVVDQLLRNSHIDEVIGTLMSTPCGPLPNNVVNIGM